MFKISDCFKLILCTVLSSGVATAGNFGQMNFAYWQKISTGPTATYLVVAGGGGGGNNAAGGGGAGGFLTGTTSLTLGTTYTVTVGTGGAGATVADANGVNGNDSIISGTGLTTIDAVGGGYGAGNDNAGSVNGGNGGSGGGASYGGGGTGGTATSGQGYRGGNNSFSGGSPYYGSGGGGAGAQGTDVSSGGNAGNGGNGLQSSITGTATYYAGGGGGGAYASNSYIGLGGLGGGGNGSYNATAGSGTNGLGGGGGGGAAAQKNGGNGGSGVVIISIPSTYAVTVTGTVTYTANGSNFVYTFTSSGSFTINGNISTFSQTNPFSDASQIAYYPLNGNTTDSMGSYNGSVTGSLSYSSVSNPFGYTTPLFNSTTGYFGSTSNSPFSGNNARSMFCWVKCNTVPQGDASGLVSTSITFGGGQEFTLTGQVATVATWSFWGYIYYLNSSITPDTNWHFFGVTYDSSTIKLYLDGSLIASLATTAINSVACPIYIGYDGYSRPDAYMNSVRIFNRALTATEVLNLYVNGR